jgi:flagellar biosynthesis/type III secretory pathway chaperone
MKEEIKNIILDYCEGINWLEFDANNLDEMVDKIITTTSQKQQYNQDTNEWGDSNTGYLGE